MIHSTENRVRNFRELKVYQMAFESAMKIFQITKILPKEEKYVLVDQIVRSSRSVCSNLSEAWRKRSYIAVFKNKLSDCSQEAAETQTWLEFSLKCNYIEEKTFSELDGQYEQIFAMLTSMDRKAHLFCK